MVSSKRKRATQQAEGQKKRRSTNTPKLRPQPRRSRRIACKTPTRPSQDAKSNIIPQEDKDDISNQATGPADVESEDSFDSNDIPVMPLYVLRSTVDEQIQDLEELLQGGEVHDEQIVNIKAIIADLKAGREPGYMYQGGKAVTEDTIDKSLDAPPVWYEDVSECFEATAYPDIGSRFVHHEQPIAKKAGGSAYRKSYM